LFHYSVTDAGASYAATAFALLNPALLIIDHGHFQYNGVCLGLVVLAVVLITSGDIMGELVGSMCFVLALNFKHMALYFSPAIFFYLLARNFSLRQPVSSIVRVGRIGVVVVASFVLLWLPFLLSEDRGKQVVVRLFPLARGIYEDKVANLWCALGPLLRFKERFAHEVLFRGAAILTLGAMSPSCVLLWLRPTRRQLVLSLASCSLSFFLCAFQVHEKNILMPLLPLSLLWGTHPELATWSTMVGLFSMFPLLERDGLVMVYAFSMAGCLFIVRKWSWWSLVSFLPFIGIHGLMAFATPPAHLPHLWIMACMFYSFVLFSILYLILLKLQWADRSSARGGKVKAQ
jgi:alpha-1,3-glucosyltransferase